MWFNVVPLPIQSVFWILDSCPVAATMTSTPQTPRNGARNATASTSRVQSSSNVKLIPAAPPVHHRKRRGKGRGQLLITAPDASYVLERPRKKRKTNFVGTQRTADLPPAADPEAADDTALHYDVFDDPPAPHVGTEDEPPLANNAQEESRHARRIFARALPGITAEEP